ncbi:MAG: hypothetical protein ACRDD8_03480 [Bacteroidales bacterium]
MKRWESGRYDIYGSADKHGWWGLYFFVSYFTNNHLRGCGVRQAMSHALNPSSVPIQDSKRGYRQITPSA